ncbi:MAG: radical SAM protein [Bradymonadaceae bacterium]|nr:radical SAM protein [Lujinxingiaceae bacterium]
MACNPVFEVSSQQSPLPPAANFHLNTSCNFKCKFCFAQFDDTKAFLGGCMLSKAQQLEIIRALPSHGVEKITFVGGEPTLVPWLVELITEAKAGGMTTMIVTNGSRLSEALLDGFAGRLDWLAFSVDSADCGLNRASGRAQRGQTMAAGQILALSEQARERGLRIKLNTVVHRINALEDMSEFVGRLGPERWKIFQVLPVEGQNSGEVEELLISEAMFAAYVERHRHLEARGVRVVAENNAAMRGSYAMIDPAGRFFDNTQGGHSYSRPILEVGVGAAFSDIAFCAQRFEERGAVYDWESDIAYEPFIAISGVSGSGKDTAAEYLVNELGYKRVAIADAIKEHVGRIFGLTDAQLWGELRNEVIAEFGHSPRAIYQRFGSVCREIDPDVWLRGLLAGVEALLSEGRRVVCTDLRTHAEFEALREAGAALWRVNRRGAGAPGELGQDMTEQQARELGERDFGVVLANDGSLEELRMAVLYGARRRR